MSVGEGGLWTRREGEKESEGQSSLTSVCVCVRAGWSSMPENG